MHFYPSNAYSYSRRTVSDYKRGIYCDFVDYRCKFATEIIGNATAII